MLYDNNKDQSSELSSCHSIALNMAKYYNLKSIAFCRISTGLYGYPKTEAAKISISTVKQWCQSHDYEIDIIFNTFTNEDTDIYKSLLN